MWGMGWATRKQLPCQGKSSLLAQDPRNTAVPQPGTEARNGETDEGEQTRAEVP